MEENEMSNILLPSTITSKGSIIKNEILEENLSKEDPQLAIVKQEYVVAWPYELQLNSKKPEVKVEIVDSEDDISIKLEPLPSEELYIKDENVPTDQLIETYTDSGFYYCSLCNRKFSDKNSLEQHLNSEIKPFECYKCDYKCIRKCAFKVHINTQCGQAPRVESCDYKCVRKDNLKQHVKTHINEKPFKCNLCDYSNIRNSHLQRHVKTHTGEKPLNCVFCDYKTARVSNLKDHVKIHTGEKPYNCDICDYKTAVASNLKRHVKAHTCEKPFNCNFCDYKSRYLNNLKRHVKMHTGN